MTEKFYPNHSEVPPGTITPVTSRMVTVDNDSTKHQQIPNLATSAISSYYHHDAAPFSNCPLPKSADELHLR